MYNIRVWRVPAIILSLFIGSILLWRGICIDELKAVRSAAETADEYQDETKRDLLALMLAYPGYIIGVERDGDKTYVLMQSGKRIIYDDKKNKSHEQKIYNADIQDMLEQVYPLSNITSIPEDGIEPGRIRAYAFLKEVYGGTESATSRNLTSVLLGPCSMPFNKNNSAAESLKKAFSELLVLICEDPGLYGYIYPLNGTYNHRVISGTNLLSAHAFGIAIDLKSDARGYWKWAAREQGQQALDSFPREIVRVFEENGFIWGGKWARFDIFHFEYRPELITKAKYHPEPEGPQSWYAGYPENTATREYIEIIENAFEQ